jgi:hypothetical protein
MFPGIGRRAHAATILPYNLQFVGLGGILLEWRRESELKMTYVKPRLFSTITRILDRSQLVKDQLLSMMIFNTDDFTALGRRS